MWETSSCRQNMCEQFFNLSFAWEDVSILPNFSMFFFKYYSTSFHPKPTPKAAQRSPISFPRPNAKNADCMVASVEAMVFWPWILRRIATFSRMLPCYLVHPLHCLEQVPVPPVVWSVVGSGMPTFGKRRWNFCGDLFGTSIVENFA